MKFRFILFLFMFCNVRGQIFNGKKAEPGKFRYVVQVHTREPVLVPDFEKDEFLNPSLICTGVIISKKFVLTAAHCVKTDADKWKDEENAWVVGGNLHLDYKDIYKPIVREAYTIKSHDSYNRRNEATMDIALLFFLIPLPLNRNSGLGSIPIGLKTDDPTAGKECQIMGWGNTQMGLAGDKIVHMDMAHYLMEGQAEVVTDRRTCAGIWSDAAHICVEIKKQYHALPLQGDSGSPLVCKNGNGQDNVFGIAEAMGKIRNNGADLYGGTANYSKLSSHKTWIDKTMARFMREERDLKERHRQEREVIRRWRRKLKRKHKREIAKDRKEKQARKDEAACLPDQGW